MNPYQSSGAAARAYATNEVQSGVLAASPQMLIVMLYDGAIRAIATAKSYLARGDLAAKGEALSKAIGIVDEGLKGSLHAESAGEIGANLVSLYDYMVRTLLQANLRNDIALMDEVAGLLRELKEAWELVARGHTRQQDSGAEPPARGHGRVLSYGKA